MTPAPDSAPSTRRLNPIRCVLWFAPIVIVPATFFALLPWVKQQSAAVSMGIAAAAAIFVMGYSVFLASRANRRLDEVEIAGQRFATTKGATVGWTVAVLVMMFPPAMNALVDLANTIGAASPDNAVRIGIVIGIMLVVLLQTLGIIAVSIWWQRRIGALA